MQAQRTESLDVRILCNLGLVAVAGVLSAHQVRALQRTHRLKDVGLFAVHGGQAAVRRRLHREQRDDLEQVVLHHVAQTAGALIKRTAALHAELLGQRDLHAGDMVAVPDRFQERIGKTEIEDVHDRFLAEEVIDAKD